MKSFKIISLKRRIGTVFPAGRIERPAKTSCIVQRKFDTQVDSRIANGDSGSLSAEGRYGNNYDMPR